MNTELQTRDPQAAGDGLSPPDPSSDSNANPNGESGPLQPSTGAIRKRPLNVSSSNGIAKSCLKVNNNLDDARSKRCCCKAVQNGLQKSEDKVNNVDVNRLSDDAEYKPLNVEPVEPLPGPSYVDFRLPVRCASSDSSSSNDDCISISDDGCIYTYKGDNVADLPDSFFNMDMLENGEQHDPQRRGDSSPEMDYLEMDFDPGPSCDADTDESSVSIDLETEDVADGPEVPKPPDDPTPEEPSESPVAACHDNKTENDLNLPKAVTTDDKESNVPGPSDANVTPVEHFEMPWIPTSREHRTTIVKPPGEATGYHSSSGDLVSPSEVPSRDCSDNLKNLSSALYHCTMAKRLIFDKLSSENITKSMIWSEREAVTNQVTQIGTSACGATAVLNALIALKYPISSNDKIKETVAARLRANSSPLAEYLLSRSEAGCTHEDIINGLHNITEGAVYAKFFHTYPERYVNLTHWLGYWIDRGAVPIATLNLQKGPFAETIPDAWHHQMIFGVGPRSVYLTNPLECVDEGMVFNQLCSDSVLLIRRHDVLSRLTSSYEIVKLMNLKSMKWNCLNVVGQVATLLRESTREHRQGYTVTSHVRIPASYSAGITFAINADNPACETLKRCPQLPLLETVASCP